MSKSSPKISKDDFIEILLDKEIMRDDDLKIFQTMYSFENHEASATDIAKELGWKGKGATVMKIVGLGKRIVKKFDIEPRQREDGTLCYWDLFFKGYFEGTFFIYQFKPSLKEALEELDLVKSGKTKRNKTELSSNEGNASQVFLTRYERDPHLRNLCIKHYGYSCIVCNFNFEKYYGKIGYNYIQVHHLEQLSAKGKTHKVHAIKDLRPVCPNCHAMLHKQNPSLTIEELKLLLN